MKSPGKKWNRGMSGFPVLSSKKKAFQREDVAKKLPSCAPLRSVDKKDRLVPLPVAEPGMGEKRIIDGLLFLVPVTENDRLSFLVFSEDVAHGEIQIDSPLLRIQSHRFHERGLVSRPAGRRFS